MKLQILYQPNPIVDHIAIAAIPDEHEDSLDMQSFVLDYAMEGLKPRKGENTIYINRNFEKESDHLVFLESRYAFADFYQWAINSKYNAKKNYSLGIGSKETTCTTAVIDALSELGIELDLKRSRKCKNLICCFWLPTTMITPKEVYEAIVEYKENQRFEQRLSTL